MIKAVAEVDHRSVAPGKAWKRGRVATTEV